MYLCIVKCLVLVFAVSEIKQLITKKLSLLLLTVQNIFGDFLPLFEQYMSMKIENHFCFVCLIRFFTSQSTIFQLCQDRSFWVEPVLSKDQCVLLKDTTQ